MNVRNDLGELFVADDLHSLVERGHELGTQTFHHSSGRSLPLAAFLDDVQMGMKAMERIGVPDSSNFAYPYGHATLRSKKNLGPVFASSRSVIPGLNGPEIDLNLLLANRLYGGADQCPLVEDLFSGTKEKRAGSFSIPTMCDRTRPNTDARRGFLSTPSPAWCAGAAGFSPFGKPWRRSG